MATIKQSVLKDIRDDQNFTSSYNAQPQSYLDQATSSNPLLTEDPYGRDVSGNKEKISRSRKIRVEVLVEICTILYLMVFGI